MRGARRCGSWASGPREGGFDSRALHQYQQPTPGRSSAARGGELRSKTEGTKEVLDLKITVNVRELTLRQYAALRGYEEQRELLSAVKAAGGKLGQPDLSAAMSGASKLWPKVRAVMAAVLFPEGDFELTDEQRDQALVELIENADKRERYVRGDDRDQT